MLPSLPCPVAGGPGPLETVSHRPTAASWSSMPRWRRARPWWVLFHVLFGLGVLGLGQLVLTGLFIQAVEIRDRPPLGDVVALSAVGFAVATGLAAWLLFVYLRRSRKARWGALIGLLVLGLAVDLGGQWVAERILTS
jgi:hypothetical protein